MSVNYLICPVCKCPLTPPSPAVTGMSCPRCNNWLEIDPSCPTSCLTCHKLKQTHADPCVTSEDEVSGPSVVKRK